MKEQYQKEVSQIHVPKELLEKTKQAMKEEELILAEQENAKKVIPFGRISMAAAAVVLLVCVPVASDLLKNKEEQIPSQNIQMHLGEQEEMEIKQIEPEKESTEDKNLIEKIVDKIEKIFD